MQSDKTQVPPRNRERLLNVISEIERVRADMSIGPTCVAYLNVAIAAIEDASNWPLDEKEHKGLTLR